MTISAVDAALYAGALLILFLTPGPVWVALTARALSGGFNAAWPLALGVVVGDVLWPLLAILGVTIDRGDRHIRRQRGEVCGYIGNGFTISQCQRHRAHLGPGRVVRIPTASAILEVPELADQVGFRLACQARCKECCITLGIGTMTGNAGAIQGLAGFGVSREGQTW